MPARQLNKLTDRKLKALLNAGKPTAKSDGGGLTFTVSANGYAAWVLRYRFGGEAREVTIGSYADYPLTRARQARAELRELIDEGIDPASHKRRQQAIQTIDAPEVGTFAELADTWFAAKIGGKWKHPETVRRVIDNWLNPVVGRMHIEDIRPKHLSGAIQSIIDGGAPTVANDARRYVQRMFDFAVIEGSIELSPASALTYEHIGTPEQARTRSLKLGEIRKLFAAMESARDWFGRPNEITVHLLLMLGVRKGELIGARWSEFDLDAAEWTIPQERLKRAKRDFTVPLPDQVVELLTELQLLAAGSEWVLPSRRRGIRRLGHISPDTLNRILADLEVGIVSFTVHDLRRTMRTQLSELGVPFAVAERCLNHKLPGIGGVYDTSAMIDQRREALDAWCEVLDTLTDEGVQAARSVRKELATQQSSNG